MGAGDVTGAGDGSGLGSRVGHMDDQMREFISSEITRNILEKTYVIFGTIKEGIMEILDEHLGAFRSEMVGACTLTFREFWACETLDFFGNKDPIVSRHWLANVTNAFCASCCRKGEKVILASCLLKDRAQY